jgi:hypothetical protein
MAPQKLIEICSEVGVRACELFWEVPQGSWVLTPLVAMPPFGERTAMILVGQTGFRITLKIHFNSKNVLSISGNNGMGSGAQPPTEVLREAVNQVGGALRTAFEASGTAIALGLPVLTRGFDEVFSRSPDGVTCFSSVWSLRDPSQQRGESSENLFVLGLLLEVSDQSSLKEGMLDPAASQCNGQDMELL